MDILTYPSPICPLFRGKISYRHSDVDYTRIAIRLGHVSRDDGIGFRLVRSLNKLDCSPDPCNGHGVCSAPTGEETRASCDCDDEYGGHWCNRCADGALGTYPDCYLPPTDFCDSNLCTAVVPTGQDLCYDASASIACPSSGNAFYGQDAQYGENDKRFYCINNTGATVDCATLGAPAAHEMVWDFHTQLYWQRTVNPDQTHGDIETICNSLNSAVYGGFDDWRAPTVAELMTLVDHSKYSPVVDSTVFSGTTGSFWAWETDAGTPSNAWSVSLYGGSVSAGDTTQSKNLHCVRGGLAFGAATESGSRFHAENISGDDIVADYVTGLTWIATSASARNWENALAYCETLDFAGETDWRLPNRLELFSLIDFSETNPATHFPGAASESLWSATTHNDSTANAWDIDLTDGNSLSADPKTTSEKVLCVRGGP